MQIGDLMKRSGVQFGTSGARGLVEAMTDQVCHAYTTAFLGYLQKADMIEPGAEVGIAGDLRSSTPRIMIACARAVRDVGCRPCYLGRIPSPATAAWGMARGAPSLMVTGSHIPDDRNGIKFNLPTGEILKRDEEAIRVQPLRIAEELFDRSGSFVRDESAMLPDEDPTAYRDYLDRYLRFFPPGCLTGLRVAVYEHSSVARAAYVDVLEGLGARVTRLGHSDVFVPVDTEAIRPEDIALALDWARTSRFDALISADGDGDRPLIGDETGRWMRGDIAGILCARELGARAVVTPVSSNTAVERCGWFETVLRTRIGSPYVIEGMQQLVDGGLSEVVGYEANGGFLLATDIEREGRALAALPTRDAVVVAIAILRAAVGQKRPISALAASLPRRFTHSDRLKDFPTEVARARLAELHSGDPPRDKAAIEAVFGPRFGHVAALDVTDGLRITFASGDIAHLRPSGNAPELRAYAEADSPERAAALSRDCMEILERWRS